MLFPQFEVFEDNVEWLGPRGLLKHLAWAQLNIADISGKAPP